MPARPKPPRQPIFASREYVHDVVQEAIAQFYQFLLENDHIKPSAKLDEELRTAAEAIKPTPARPPLEIVSR